MEFGYRSPLGTILIESSNKKIIRVSFTNSKPGDEKDRYIQQVCDYFDCYFSGGQPDISKISVHLHGTQFQMKIWQYLQEIPYGETITYGQLALQYATEHKLNRMSPQAVGQAVRANPIAILIPCHRVVGTKGKLTGYAGGLDKKAVLLAIEKANKVL